MHNAATVGQLVLFVTACTGMLVFHKRGLVDWKLALVIDPPTDIMALTGGYMAHMVPGASLKYLLAGLLVLAGLLMLIKVTDRPVSTKKNGLDSGGVALPTTSMSSTSGWPFLLPLSSAWQRARWASRAVRSRCLLWCCSAAFLCESQWRLPLP